MKPPSVSSSLNYYLLVGILSLCGLACLVIVMLLFYHPTPAQVGGVIASIVAMVVLGLLGWMLRDLHNALNSRLDEMKNIIEVAALAEGIVQGRAEMRKEQRQDDAEDTLAKAAAEEKRQRPQ